MNERVDADGDRDGGTTTPEVQLPNADAQPWRPSRRQVIVGGFLLGAFVVLLNGARLYMRLASNCDMPLWVYCINCPKLSEMPATLERSPVGPYTAVELYGGYTSETVYFNAAGRLVTADVFSDTDEYCQGTEHSRWFGQRFWAVAEPYPPYDTFNARPRWTYEKYPTPEGADNWR